MKPLRILIFFVAVFSLLFLLSVVFPKDGLQIGNELKLQFASASDLFAEDSLPTVYTDSIIQYATLSDDPEFGELDSVFTIIDTLEKVNIDSIIKVRIDSISKRVFPIEYIDGSEQVLHSFFSNADECQANGALLRILHYGDSQIENDRMTSLLRYRLQKVFGGSGCGMVPAIPLYFGNPTYKEQYEGNWVRYTGFGKRDTTLEHNCFGSLACFTSVPEPLEGVLPSISFNFIKGRRASRFSEMKIFLHAYVDSGMLRINLNSSDNDSVIYLRDGYNAVSFIPDTTVRKVRLEFDLKEGGRIYGLAFDPNNGVQMDNIAMRGSSGLEFRRTDSLLLTRMYDDLNPGLILMQFGGNVVPYITNAGYYKRKFKKELIYLQELCPEVPVIVLGPADMSQKVNGQFQTWENLEPVRNALREAALESGCGFWDMYEAMGGENSMQNFVQADPALATTDYIHFTPKGANLMAGMFFDALMLEYRRYQSAGAASQ